MIVISIEEKIEKLSEINDKIDELNFKKQDIEEEIHRMLYSLKFEDVLSGKISNKIFSGFDIPYKFYPFFSFDKYSFASIFKNKLPSDCQLEVFVIESNTVRESFGELWGYVLSPGDFTHFEIVSTTIGKIVTRSKIIFYEKIKSDMAQAKQEFIFKHLPTPNSLNNSCQADFAKALKESTPVYSSIK